MKGTLMRALMLSLILVPVTTSANLSDGSSFSSLSYELFLHGQVVRGANGVASDYPGVNRWGIDRGTMRLACADGVRTLSSVSLFEGGTVSFRNKGDQIHMHVRESKVQPADEQITQVPSGQCQDLSATEIVLVDHAFDIPVDTDGRAVTVDLGGGYSLRVMTQRID